MVVRYDDVLLETDQELTFACYMRQPGATYDWHAWMLAHDNVYVYDQLSFTTIHDGSDGFDGGGRTGSAPPLLGDALARRHSQYS